MFFEKKSKLKMWQRGLFLNNLWIVLAILVVGYVTLGEVGYFGTSLAFAQKKEKKREKSSDSSLDPISLGGVGKSEKSDVRGSKAKDVAGEKNDVPAPGAEVNLPQKRESHRNENISISTKPSGTAFSLYLALDLGIAKTTPKESDLETAKSGFQYGGKILGSFYTNDMAGDFGVGYLRSQLKGDKDYSENKDTSTLSEFSNVTVLTYAAYAEFSPRVRIGKNIQIGPLGQVFFGADSSFGAEDHPTGSTTLAGLQFLFAGGENLMFRGGVQLLTDINIYARQLYLGIFTIQIGIPVVKQTTIVKTIEDVTRRENEKVKRVVRDVKKSRVVESVKILFDSETVHFVTNSAKLSEKSESFLESVGRFLATNPEEWKSIKIEGHTDKRGTEEHNMKLSTERADAVRRVMVAAGVPENKITSMGYGFHQPLFEETDPMSLAKNRRVEMSFEGVRNTELIGNTINTLRSQFQ